VEFIHHDPVCGRHWPGLYREFAEFQPVLCDTRGAVVAAGVTIPPGVELRRAERLDAPRRHDVAGNVMTCSTCASWRTRSPFGKAADEGRDEWTRWPEGRSRQERFSEPRK